MNGTWGSRAVVCVLAAFSAAGCVGGSDEAFEIEQTSQALTTCDGPEDLGLECGANGRVCSATAHCVYPAACNSSATGPGVFFGNLTVDGAETLADLAQVGGVWCVTGNLSVMGTPLTDLSSLGALVAVGGSVTVQQNAALTNLAGLDALQSAVSVKVVANANLTALTGLGGLKRLASLEVVGNGKLPSLDGLAPVDITSSVSLTGNGKLVEVDALSGIVGPMAGYLHVQNETSLTDLSGLSRVTSIGSSLRIFNSDALTGLAGLDAITRVGGELSITLNDRLASLGLGAVTQVGSLKVQANPLLDQCAVDALRTRTSAVCNSCTGQLGCDGYCTAAGACAPPAVVSVFNTSDGHVGNPPATQDGVFNPGDIVSAGVRVENRGPVAFSMSLARIVTTDPFVSGVFPLPSTVYTSQVAPGASGYAYPHLRIANGAPEGHVVSYAVEVDYTIAGVTRTASLAQSLTVGPGDPDPGVPLTVDLVRYHDGYYPNANPNDGHFAPGEVVAVGVRLRNWTHSPQVVTNRVIITSYEGAEISAGGTIPITVAAADTLGRSYYVTLAPDAPLGVFEGTLQATGTVDGQSFVASMPVSFDVTAP